VSRTLSYWRAAGTSTSDRPVPKVCDYREPVTT
jgi:hypothetical protein